MKTTADYLDALRARFNAPSDYALCKFTGWHRQQISRYRKQLNTFDDDTCMKVASWLHVEPSEIAVNMQWQRANTPAKKALWELVAKKAYGIAAGALIVLAMPELMQFAPGLTPESVASHAVVLSAVPSTVYYVKQRP